VAGSSGSGPRPRPSRWDFWRNCRCVASCSHWFPLWYNWFF
jgi:hypothetical protein